MLALSASLFTLSCTLPMLADNFRGEINNYLGTTNEKVEVAGDLTKEEKLALFPYKSSYGSTKELVQALADVGERMSEEGTVLLKNRNGALPLDENHRKVTLLGTTAYNPLQGGEMGSGFQRNNNTDADTVALINGFKRKGIEYSTVVQQAYKNAGAKAQRTTSVTGTEKFANNEVSLDALAAADPDWQREFADYSTAVIVLGRASSEQASYFPGEDHVSDADRALNQKDTLGLNDNERALINLACRKKKDGVFSKVIVLVNSACPMEIGEIQQNDDVDSILQIGFPGGYGFYGIADVLKGEVSPSGHLADTYATDSTLSPAAQNYGIYQWSNLSDINASEAYSGKLINNYLVEAEGIYKGYAYYETRYEDQILSRNNASSAKGSTDGNWDYKNEVTYPFGYGLSYTDFTETLGSIKVDLKTRKVTADVQVTNTGNASGKDAVQLYVHAPYIEGGVEKSAIKLIDFEKTPLLEKGESAEVQLSADLQDIASYDSEAGLYILNPGTYSFAVGNGAHEALNNVLKEEGVAAERLEGEVHENCVKTWVLEQRDEKTLKKSANGTEIQNRLADADLNYYQPGTVTYLSRKDWDGTFPKSYKGIRADEKMLPVLGNDLHPIEADNDPEVTFGAKNGYTLYDLENVSDIRDERWSKLMDQITLEECMERIPFGGASCKPIASISSPEAVQYDGPNGFNNQPLGNKVESMSSMKDTDPAYFTNDDKNYKFKGGVMGNETLIAQTFSKEMAKDYGAVTGNYSIWTHVTILWGAGMNLHRCPYNARNHEYYSEDAVLSGKIGASYIAESRKFGALISPKHFAFNDTEIQRFGIAPFMTEQDARETELRSFQFAVEEGGCLGLMTSLSRIGITSINSHEGLMLGILRNEWGYTGLISTDAATNKYYFSVKELAHCGVTMTTMTNGDISGGWEYWTADNVSKDHSLEADVKRCMLYQNYALANSNAMNGIFSGMKRTHVNAWYDNLILGMEIGFGILTAGALTFCVYSYLKERNGKENG